MIDLRLRAYAPNGAALGLLPDALDLQAGLPLADVSSLAVTYSRLTAGGTVLDRDLGAGLELALEYSTGGAWAEPRNARFLYLKRTFDVVDDTDTVKATCPGYAWQLRKARVEHLAGVEPVDGKRPFLSATTGAILVTLLAEAQARGEVTGFTTAATSTHDSAGQPWAKIITIYYEPGLDLWSVLDNLTQQGMCDWAMQGRELQLYNPDTALAVDRTTGADPTALRLGRDVTNAPSDESIEELISRAVLRGDNGLLLVEDNPLAPTPWGVWTGAISQGGVSDEGTARALAQADLERGSRVRGQYTRELVTTGPVPPLTAYTPGDYVLASGATRALERLRVRQVTLSKSDAGVTGNVILNDRVLEAELRRSRRMSGIVGGASSDGGSGARPTPEGPDRRTPAAPTGLVVDSDAYIDGAGMPRAAVTATWAPVTHATNGTVMEGVSYVLWGRPDEAEAEWRSLLTTDATTVTASPFEVGAAWRFRVVAVSASAIASDPSADVSVTMADDTTPPPAPTAPVLTSRLGTITVAWDGRAAGGGPMPRDFERVEVRDGVPGTPGGIIGTLRASSGADFLVVAEAPYGVEQAFWFRAVDRSGNASDWSSSSTITVTPLVDDDLVGTTIQQAIDEAQDTAETAQASADGKNTVHYAATAPAGTAHKVGDTWFDTANGYRISRWSGSAWVQSLLAGPAMQDASITARKVLIGSAENMIPNGAGELGSGAGWDPALTWVTDDKPEGLPGAMRSAPGSGTIGPGIPEFFSVQPSTEYLAEVWLKADKPNSNLYIELRDQDGNLGVTSDALPGFPANPSRGYLLGQVTVPTSWTRYLLKVITRAGATRLRVVSLYFNHSSGAERTAQVWISGLRMRPRATGQLIVDGTIEAQKLLAGTITAESGIIGSVDAGKITVGTLDAARIAARSITADKVLVGGANLLPDPDFHSAAWGRTGGITTSPEGGLNGSGSLLIPASASQVGSYFGINDGALRPRVVPGKPYRVSAWVLSPSAISGGRATIYVRWHDDSGSPTGWVALTNVSNGGPIAANTWALVEGILVAPEGATRAVFGLYKQGSHSDSLRWSVPVLAPAVDSSLVVDGAIVARTIAASAVEAGKIAANAVTADKIAAGAVTATKIAADAIDGKTITGALIQTEAGVSAGVKLDSSGLKAYDANGNRTVSISAATGAVDITVGSGSNINANYADGTPAAFMGTIYSGGTTIEGHGILVQSPDTGGANQGPDIFTAKHRTNGDREVIVGQQDATIRGMWVYAEHFSVKAPSSMTLDSGGQVLIKSATKRVFIDHDTTTVAATAYLSTAGGLYRVTSGRKYKLDIEDFHADPDAVLALRPRSWRDRREVEENPDTERRQIGFIAEEVDELVPELVLRDEDGNPDSLAYDRMIAAYHAVIVRQQEQITALAARLDALEAAAGTGEAQ